MWQARHVHTTLQAAYPDIEFEIVGMTTAGDKDLTTPLHAFASKGVFTKELDVGLAENHIDIAVHCVKDVATKLPEGQSICAVLKRGDVADVVVLHEKHLDAFRKAKEAHEATGKSTNSGRSIALSILPPGSIVGTSSLRRGATIARLHPGLECRGCRGNLATRLSKLDSGQYDAIILARIGLERLGLGERIAEILSPEVYSSAVGQGALVVVCRSADTATRDLVAKALHHAPTEWACALERGMLATLQGGCKVPIAIHTTITVAPTRSAELFVEMVNSERAALMDRHAEQVEAQKAAAAAGNEETKQKHISAVGLRIEPPWTVTSEAETENTLMACTDADKSVVLISRGTVMTLDGKSVIECSVALALPLLRPDGVQRARVMNPNEIEAALAADVGAELGESLRKLGAEAILMEAKQ